MNYRKSDGAWRTTAAGFGTQAGRLINSERSRQHHSEARAIFDAEGEASEGDGGKPERRSRKTMPVESIIDMRRERDIGLLTYLPVLHERQQL